MDDAKSSIFSRHLRSNASNNTPFTTYTPAPTMSPPFQSKPSPVTYQAPLLFPEMLLPEPMFKPIPWENIKPAGKCEVGPKNPRHTDDDLLKGGDGENIDDILASMGGDGSIPLDDEEMDNSDPSLDTNEEQTAQIKYTPYTFVSTTSLLATLVDTLCNTPTTPPAICLRVEGIEVSRYGTISILAIHIIPQNENYLIDVLKLRALAFNTPGAIFKNKTLKTILEDPEIPLLLFDCRKDNDALVNLFEVQMNNVIDIQLLHTACEPQPQERELVMSLSGILEQKALLDWRELQAWRVNKLVTSCLSAEENRDDRWIFNQRPLNPQVAEACLQDLIVLNKVFVFHCRLLSNMGRNHWKPRIRDETLKRLALSDDPHYDACEVNYARWAPEGWKHLTD
ncbi:hypothetical protein TWF730_002537 [Orbilia blumenaviensis]|uniref:3'-5' exonuclease domain-containing protein n=1 Tax=Orbilia blumenaviensis TaxID=1796055 RepID=A0AAV9UDN7_9PEZI